MFLIYFYCLIVGAFFSIIFLLFDEVISLPGPFNLLVLTSFITLFGGSGLFLWNLEFLSLEWVFIFSILISFCFTSIFYFIYSRSMCESENSIAFSMQNLVGSVGEMLTSIQENGYGEVLIRFGASYINQIVASTSGDLIVKGARVRIDSVKEGILYVSVVKEKM